MLSRDQQKPDAVGLQGSKVEGMKMCLLIRMVVFALIACATFAQNGPSSQETALKTQFIEVQPDVKLEVLDWGGPGATSYFSQVA